MKNNFSPQNTQGNREGEAKKLIRYNAVLTRIWLYNTTKLKGR
jgi:hypothetical protein